MVLFSCFGVLGERTLANMSEGLEGEASLGLTGQEDRGARTGLQQHRVWKECFPHHSMRVLLCTQGDLCFRAQRKGAGLCPALFRKRRGLADHGQALHNTIWITSWTRWRIQSLFLTFWLSRVLLLVSDLKLSIWIMPRVTLLWRSALPTAPCYPPG